MERISNLRWRDGAVGRLTTTETGDLSSIPGTRFAEAENTRCLLTCTTVLFRAYTQAHTDTPKVDSHKGAEQAPQPIPLLVQRRK